jgi:hypothetical protein
MTRAYFTQSGFNYGQLGALLRARSDTKYYTKGVRKLKNFSPKPQGPIVKRKGTLFIEEVKNSNKKVRLVKFVFSEIDSYVLEFGDLYVRFYQGIARVGAPYEIVSPYTETQIQDLKFAQLGDICYIAHPAHQSRKLSRLAALSWLIDVMDNRLGPVLDWNKTTTTITLTGSVAVDTASTWTASAAIFNPLQVGSVWGIAANNTSDIGYAEMTGYTSPTVATFNNQTALFALATPVKSWREAAWSGTQGYPRAVAFHEQRLFFGGTDESPLTIWGSVSNGAFEVYDIDDATADDASVFTLTGRANTIQWLISNGRFLVAGTFGGLAFCDFSGATNTPIPTVYNGSSYGASKLQGVQVNSVIAYPSSNNKSLYRAEYSDASLQYVSLDLNDLNPEFLETGAEYVEIIEQPDIAVVMVANGKLKILNYDATQAEGNLPLIGWYSVEIDGYVESVTVVPTTGDDRVWVVVRRTINSVTKRYVECFDISDDKLFLDSAKKYTGAATRTFSGLSHLEGKTVKVLGDGAYAGDYTVASGAITIPNSKTAIATAYIGLGYDADMQTLPVNIAIPTYSYSTQTLKCRINEVCMILYQTLTLKIGESFDKLKAIPFRASNDTMTEALPLFGNDYPDIIETSFGGDHNRQPSICFRSDLPFPCTIIGYTARMEVNSQ